MMQISTVALNLKINLLFLFFFPFDAIVFFCLALYLLSPKTQICLYDVLFFVHWLILIFERGIKNG